MNINPPKRGDIFVCDFSPTMGHEQSGIRPAIVLSDSDFNAKTDLILACPITTSERGYFFEVKVKTEKTKGVILTHHIRTIDFVARHGKVVDKVDKKTLKEVIEKIKVLIER